ncbi:hypothetical protein TNCV_413531 [Trichonephila clavipes]|nr:hypothetical protein TNCV_413531 [Trichonephila clavipes]
MSGYVDDDSQVNIPLLSKIFQDISSLIIRAEFEAVLIVQKYSTLDRMHHVPESVQMLWLRFPNVATVAAWSWYRIVAGLVTSSSPVPLKTRRVGEPMHVKSVESSNVLPLMWCGS